MSVPVIHVAHPGTQRGFRVANILANAGRLGSFYTTMAFNRDSCLGRAFPNRSVDGILASRVQRMTPAWEWIGLLASRLGFSEEVLDGFLLKRNRSFGRRVGRCAGVKGDVLYGFDTASAAMFRAAKERGLYCVLDQSIIHTIRAQKILKDAAKARPAYADSLSGLEYVQEELFSRQDEARQANLVICPSDKVAESVVEAGAEISRVCILPFGIDVSQFSAEGSTRGPMFRVLFSGQVSQRKGVGYLLEAWRLAKLANAELLIAGDIPGSFDWAPHIPSGARLLGRISRSEMIALYRSSDCVALPTLMEGQSNAALEAMACGSCLITTPECGLGKRLKSTLNGFELAADDVDAWAGLLQRLSADRPEARRLGEAAARDAGEFSIDVYAKRLVQTLDERFY